MLFQGLHKLIGMLICQEFENCDLMATCRLEAQDEDVSVSYRQALHGSSFFH
jgi:hypothetical protein